MTGIRIQANFQIVLKYNICKIHKSISGYEITMKFGLQHPIFSFDYRNGDSSQIVDYLKNIIQSAENRGFDSFWTMDHFHQIPIV
jgi:hypothetical protein